MTKKKFYKIIFTKLASLTIFKHHLENIHNYLTLKKL